ncbi:MULTISPECIES: AfsA-related hotdog domain-containing protein [Acinetobacter]|uniref:AfsA-related hotdog domain-containing protein n=1 Tax=Acinetobacter TaxID=469 RepID=UPI0002D3FF1E|nr:MULTISPECIES: AfsA-related hotdog domain-containing protein [Acinetobacter]
MAFILKFIVLVANGDYQMKSKKIIIVGDKFHEFANGKNVLTISQLELLTLIPSKIIDCTHEIVVGQGINKDFAEKLVQSNHIDNEKIKICSLKEIVNSKKNCYSHKKVDHNILIGSAHKVVDKDNTYNLSLHIDERCELMADHQTGQHIQGMILVEACRQTFIAVTEEFIYNKNKDFYYVINDMSTNFLNFLFPLPATISFEFTEIDMNDRRGKFKSRMQIIQEQNVCAVVEINFSVYPSKIILEKENMLANDVATKILMSEYTPISGVAYV